MQTIFHQEVRQELLGLYQHVLGKCKGEEYHLQKGRAQEEGFAIWQQQFIVQRARGDTILSIVMSKVAKSSWYWPWRGSLEALLKRSANFVVGCADTGSGAAAA